ncbi:diaminopimelate epimerase [Rubricella aquisinus]|nr:diaminopimelate epimerase [Rubricella aquisinus]
MRFLKMHGLGNDFVMLDARGQDVRLSAPLVRAIGDRHRGVGFDQLIVLRDGDGADVTLDFWNADGSTAGACGNGTRCAARLVFDDLGTDRLTLRTERGLLQAEHCADGRIRVNMGAPELTWDRVPLARDIPLDPLPLDGSPAAVGMGNPHCVFFVEDVAQVDLPTLGARFEHDPLFPERTNVEFVQVIDRSTLRMRVWERGGMITQACGSGACAVAVAAALRGLTERTVRVILDGGPLDIDWREDGVWMTGETALTFEGTFSDAFLAGAA